MNTQPVVVLGSDGPIGAAVAEGIAARGASVLRLASLSEAGDGVGAVIDAGPVSGASPDAELTSLDGAAWEALAEAPLRRALGVLKNAHRCLAIGGGRIVVLLPSVVTTGAAGAVPSVAAAEGYRSLTKAAARAWRRDGITINCVLVSGDLGDTGDLTDVVAAFALGDLGRMTGQTVAVDGGVWMTP